MPSKLQEFCYGFLPPYLQLPSLLNMGNLQPSVLIKKSSAFSICSFIPYSAKFSVFICYSTKLSQGEFLCHSELASLKSGLSTWHNRCQIWHILGHSSYKKLVFSIQLPVQHNLMILSSYLASFQQTIFFSQIVFFFVILTIFCLFFVFFMFLKQFSSFSVIVSLSH